MDSGSISKRRRAPLRIPSSGSEDDDADDDVLVDHHRNHQDDSDIQEIFPERRSNDDNSESQGIVSHRDSRDDAELQEHHQHLEDSDYVPELAALSARRRGSARRSQAMSSKAIKKPRHPEAPMAESDDSDVQEFVPDRDSSGDSADEDQDEEDSDYLPERSSVRRSQSESSKAIRQQKQLKAPKAELEVDSDVQEIVPDRDSGDAADEDQDDQHEEDSDYVPEVAAPLPARGRSSARRSQAVSSKAIRKPKQPKASKAESDEEDDSDVQEIVPDRYTEDSEDTGDDKEEGDDSDYMPELPAPPARGGGDARRNQARPSSRTANDQWLEVSESDEDEDEDQDFVPGIQAKRKRNRAISSSTSASKRKRSVAVPKAEVCASEAEAGDDSDYVPRIQGSDKRSRATPSKNPRIRHKRGSVERKLSESDVDSDYVPRIRREARGRDNAAFKASKVVKRKSPAKVDKVKPMKGKATVVKKARANPRARKMSDDDIGDFLVDDDYESPSASEDEVAEHRALLQMQRLGDAEDDESENEATVRDDLLHLDKLALDTIDAHSIEILVKGVRELVDHMPDEWELMMPETKTLSDVYTLPAVKDEDQCTERSTRALVTEMMKKLMESMLIEDDIDTESILTASMKELQDMFNLAGVGDVGVRLWLERQGGNHENAGFNLVLENASFELGRLLSEWRNLGGQGKRATFRKIAVDERRPQDIHRVMCLGRVTLRPLSPVEFGKVASDQALIKCMRSLAGYESMKKGDGPGKAGCRAFERLVCYVTQKWNQKLTHAIELIDPEGSLSKKRGKVSSKCAHSLISAKRYLELLRAWGAFPLHYLRESRHISQRDCQVLTMLMCFFTKYFKEQMVEVHHGRDHYLSDDSSSSM